MGRDVPQPDRLVRAGGGQRAPVGAERDAVTASVLAVQDPDGALIGVARSTRRSGCCAPRARGLSRVCRRVPAAATTSGRLSSACPAADADESDDAPSPPSRALRCPGAAPCCATAATMASRRRGARESAPAIDPSTSSRRRSRRPLLQALNSSRRRADPRHQELARDLVEVEVAAALAAHEPRLALEPLERALEQGRRDVLILAHALDQVLGRDHVARAGRGDHLAEQRDRCAASGRAGMRRAPRRDSPRAAPATPLRGEQRLRVVGLPQPQADRLHLGQAELAGAEPLRERGAQTLGELRVELAREVAGVALERSADDRRQRRRRRAAPAGAPGRRAPGRPRAAALTLPR